MGSSCIVAEEALRLGKAFMQWPMEWIVPHWSELAPRLYRLMVWDPKPAGRQIDRFGRRNASRFAEFEVTWHEVGSTPPFETMPVETSVVSPIAGRFIFDQDCLRNTTTHP